MLVTDPGGQYWHEPPETLLYCPAIHAVHRTAPEAFNVFVTKPREHSAQGTVETLPYRPAAHALHATAPDAFNVFVTEPAWHTVQLV